MRLRMAVLAAAMLTACSGAPQPGPAPMAPAPTDGAARETYAALGASETTGAGTADPVRQSFPQRFFNELDRGSIYYNFGIPAETVAAAIRDELPPALAARPTLATVWFNVDDLIAGVDIAAYESQLDHLIAKLREGGVSTILVANTPYLDRLPAYLACQAPKPPLRCPLAGLKTPTPGELNLLIDAYNAAIQRVVTRHGGVLVDLHAAGEVPDEHPDYVSADGFHPSTAGAAAIAKAFSAAYLRSRRG